MKRKIQSRLTAILLLLAVACSKDNSNISDNSYTRGNNGTSNYGNAGQSGSISDSQASDAFATTMDNAQSEDLSVPGKWVVYYDWGCDGRPGATVTTFNSDGTWSDDEGYTGIWVKGRHMLMFTFDNFKTTYSGVIFAREVKGIQSTFRYAGSLQGCFNMAPYSGNLLNKRTSGSMDASGNQK
jgi:hypothetical protein